MVRSRQISTRSKLGFSLVEALIVLAAIVIISAIAVPTVSRIRENALHAAASQNAKQIESLSHALAGLGVAHVIPDSMGGVEATVRLLREGVIVSEGPMAGERLILSGMRDSDIEEVARYLLVEYDQFELRLVYREPIQGNTALDAITDRVLLCALSISRSPSLLGGILKR